MTIIIGNNTQVNTNLKWQCHFKEMRQYYENLRTMSQFGGKRN
jgi:hypothetical protein